MIPREIPVVNLRPGMTTYKEDAKGHLIKDDKLSKLFDITKPLSFFTDSGKVVIWRPCGRIFVTF